MIFSISAIYSMQNISFQLGSPQATTMQDNELVFTFPIRIVNNGLYDLNDLNISTEIQDAQNSIIAQGFTFLPVVDRAEALNMTHQIEVNLTDTLQTHQYLAFEDADLNVNTTVSMRTAELISLQVSSNITVPWGAPLYNLTFGTPMCSVQIDNNSMRFYRVTVPMAFENHASFDLNGTIQLDLLGNGSIPTVASKTFFDVPQQSAYQADLSLDVPASDFSANWRFEASFETSFVNYGPVVIPYGS
jgi:hypothetical protein